MIQEDNCALLRLPPRLHSRVCICGSVGMRAVSSMKGMLRVQENADDCLGVEMRGGKTTIFGLPGN
ncbi:Uncharacterised protein [uncultured archaeon]|nr:Uncharacterised protein [uncultured archaeon]